MRMCVRACMGAVVPEETLASFGGGFSIKGRGGLGGLRSLELSVGQLFTSLEAGAAYLGLVSLAAGRLEGLYAKIGPQQPNNSKKAVVSQGFTRTVLCTVAQDRCHTPA